MTNRHGVSPAAVGFALAIAAVTVVAYQGVLSSEFIRFDDPRYVTENVHVREGLTAEGARWALTAVHSSNWQPLSWLSHMLDVELFGLEPGGHHATNLALHVANAVLLLLVLSAATGAVVPSALVAALFALHPTHVESVAWVAERKDVLSTFFGLLAIAAYVAFARRGGAGRYALVVLGLTLSLLSKQMLVTLPFLLLLLDHWPLERLRSGRIGRLVLEKVPLLLLVAVFVAVTVWAHAWTLGPNRIIPLEERIANAVMSYGLYVWKTLWPADLALVYPHPSLPGGTPWQAWQVGAMSVALLAATAAALGARARPYLAVGWLWFLGLLVPVIGLLQTGTQGMADRYTYLPAVGLYVMVAFGAADVVRSRPRLGRPLAALAVAWVAALSFVTWNQVGHWRDSYSIFSHSVAVAPGALVMHSNLGNVLLDRGEVDAAIEQYEIAIGIESGRAHVHRPLAIALRRKGRIVEAVRHELIARGIEADSAAGLVAIGQALEATGDADGALASFRKSVEVDPEATESRTQLGMALLRHGDDDGGLRHLREAVRLDEGSAKHRTNLGHALFRAGNTAEAIEHYRAAVAAAPETATAFRNLGDALLQSGELDEAIVFYRQGVLLAPDSKIARDRLDGALAMRETRAGQSDGGGAGSGGR